MFICALPYISWHAFFCYAVRRGRLVSGLSRSHFRWTEEAPLLEEYGVEEESKAGLCLSHASLLLSLKFSSLLACCMASLSLLSR